MKLVQTVPQKHMSGSRYRTSHATSFATTGPYYYYWEMCSKDTEPADGLGLPGHHHCGERSISYSVVVSSGWIG